VLIFFERTALIRFTAVGALQQGSVAGRVFAVWAFHGRRLF
jgi:hypothetical protein